MSPAALALAIGLHVLVAAALWWASPLRRLDHAETPIMISIEPEPLSAGSATAAASPAPPAVPASPTPAAAEPKATEAAPAPSEPPQQAALAPSPTHASACDRATAAASDHACTDRDTGTAACGHGARIASRAPPRATPNASQ